jgi:hypothetical protein
VGWYLISFNSIQFDSVIKRCFCKRSTAELFFSKKHIWDFYCHSNYFNKKSNCDNLEKTKFLLFHQNALCIFWIKIDEKCKHIWRTGMRIEKIKLAPLCVKSSYPIQVNRSVASEWCVTRRLDYAKPARGTYKTDSTYWILLLNL